MSVLIYKGGKVVSRSKNLRGLIHYGHKHKVKSVTIIKTGEGAAVTVWFRDGATVKVEYASFQVATTFFEERQRKWGGVIEGTGRDPVWNQGTPMPEDYTCCCGLYVHPSKRNPAALHISDCPYKEAKQ